MGCLVNMTSMELFPQRGLLRTQIEIPHNVTTQEFLRHKAGWLTMVGMSLSTGDWSGAAES